MGLDNIPNTYACQTRGTAVMVTAADKDGNPILDENGLPEVALSCEKTQEAGGCPWKTVLGDRDGQVLGLFGTECWYRGKYGVWLLDELGMSFHAMMLYGEGEEIGSGHISEDQLHRIADAIQEKFLNEDGTRQTEIIVDGENRAADVWYLADWCRFTATYSDGAEAWY